MVRYNKSKDANFVCEYKVSHFLWRVAELHQAARRLQLAHGVFWTNLSKTLQDFDEKHPTSRCLATVQPTAPLTAPSTPPTQPVKKGPPRKPRPAPLSPLPSTSSRSDSTQDGANRKREKGKARMMGERPKENV